MPPILKIILIALAVLVGLGLAITFLWGRFFDKVGPCPECGRDQWALKGDGGKVVCGNCNFEFDQ